MCLAESTRVGTWPPQRPSGPSAGYQDWRRLFFAHWRVDSGVLRRLVPEPLTIDEYDGAAYVSLTPFFIESARPIGAPSSVGLDFVEANVRTYVRLAGGEPGVYFFSLDAASLLAAVGARISLGLPYFWASGHVWRTGDEIDYRLQRRWSPAGCHVRYAVGRPREHATPGTLDHFLVERYLLHVRRSATLWTVRVHHHPYPLRDVRLLDLRDSLLEAAGIRERGQPDLVHFATGVDVEVFPPRVRLCGRY